jgi:Carboxypeptidase regulatory-like domain
MKKLSPISIASLTIIAAALTMLATVHPAMAPERLVEIRGAVRDLHGQPVASIKISLMNWFGEVAASAVTDDNGTYQIENVAPRKYYVRIRPLAIAGRGQLVVITVPAHRMRMNMTLTRNIPAIASAERTSSPV